MAFIDRFIPAVAEACDYIEHNATTTQARLAAKERKIGVSLAAMKNAANPNPYAGLLDMVVMVTLLSDAVDAPAAKELYGVYGQRLSVTLAQQREEIWTLAAQFITDAQLQELRQSIKTWQQAHSGTQYVAFVRMSQFPVTSQIKNDNSRRANSVFGLLFLDPLSNLDPAVREVEMTRQLAERVFFFLQRMPIVLAWQVDQSYAQMLSAPEVQNTISSVATAAGSTTRFVDATDRFAGSVERFRADIPRLRQEAVEQVEQAVARQRDVAIQQTTTRISAERVAAVEQLGSTVRTEQGEFSKSAQQALNATIDHLYWRAIGLVCVIVIAALVYRIAARKLTPIATMKNDSPQPTASPK